MAIKAGKVLRTATAAARKVQRKQLPEVSPSSGVGTFLGIPKVPRSGTDLLISKYIKINQNRLTKKGDFSEEKLKTMLSGRDRVGINETLKLLDGKALGESSGSSGKSKNTK